MQITEETLRSLTADCCSSMLELQLTSIAAPDDPAEKYLVGVVRILGAGTAGLEVAVPPKLAQHIAGTMFATSGDELSDDEVFDAIGEVANIIGGGVKGLLEGESSLSIPCVDCVPGSSYELYREGDCVDVHFECQGEPFLVRYIEITASPVAST